MDTSFRPLSWGLSFNFPSTETGAVRLVKEFSSPFLGTFFQFCETNFIIVKNNESFRPLSWGLSFNTLLMTRLEDLGLAVFVPFLGDFLSIFSRVEAVEFVASFSSPFLGTFFQ